MPIGTASKVEKEPMTAAPMPAIWPMGSMAMELKLPKRIPMQKKLIIKNANNKYNGGCPLKGMLIRSSVEEHAMIVYKAPCDSNRMPYFLTIWPLTNEAKPTAIARLAK